jgi:hypothetical protein
LHPDSILTLHSIKPVGHVVGEVAPAGQYEPFTKDKAAQEKCVLAKQGMTKQKGNKT